VNGRLGGIAFVGSPAQIGGLNNLIMPEKSLFDACLGGGFGVDGFEGIG
jgi:hypothetical protein